jgi:hypothetical protein
LSTVAKFLAFYLLIGSLLPGNDFSQLLRLENLFEHYGQHQAEARERHEAGESFLAFCWSHLNTPNGHDHHDGGASHQGLPLQSIGSGLMVFVTPAPNWQLQPPADLSAHRFFIFAQAPSHDFTGRIFQPPIQA